MPKASTTIGLTGNIGTGKSTVLEMLHQFGAHTIDADKVAHQVVLPGGQAYHAIVTTFGGDVLTDDGTIDRQKLGQIVFEDPVQLQALERIVHPAVFEHIRLELAQATESVIVIEAIKLLETGMALTLCDQVWVVITGEDQQIKRLMASRNMSQDAAEARMLSQSPQSFKISQADVVLDNNGGIQSLAEQVQRAWNALETQSQLT